MIFFDSFAIHSNTKYRNRILKFCKKIFPKKIQIGFKTLKDYKQYAKWVREVEIFDEKLKKQKETAEFLNYVQDDINALRKQGMDEMRAAADFNKDEKFFEEEF